MSTATSNISSLPIREAQSSDIQSLTTILARSFHPTNPYMKRVNPDTPAVRAWWAQIFTHQINSPDCRVLVCISPSHDTPASATTVVGVLCLQLNTPGSTPDNFWTKYPLTADHDAEGYNSMINAGEDNSPEIFKKTKHFGINLFGVESAFQGKGVGGRMMKEACRIADQEGCMMGVMANAFARKFYERNGFLCQSVITMPGDEGYEECILIREAGVKREDGDKSQSAVAGNGK